MVAVSSPRSEARIERLTCRSRIAEVAVYARGAVVTREVELPQLLSASAIDLVVDEITPLAEPGSFRVEIDGDREALGVVTELEIPEDQVREGELLRRIMETRQALVEQSTKRMRWEARRSSIARAHPLPRLTKKNGFADPDGHIKNALGAQSLLGELEEDLDRRIVTLDREISDLRKTLERLEAEAAQREGSVVQPKHHPELRAVIRLAAQDAPLRSITLSYGVSEARWWPTYAVHLTDGARKAELFVDALVAQATFEDWRDVKLSLSTADMIRDVRLPELTSLRLGRAQPPKKRGFRDPPPDLDQLFAGLDDALIGIVRKPAPVPPALHRLQTSPPELPKGGFDEDITGVGWVADTPVPQEEYGAVTRSGAMMARQIIEAGGGMPPPAPPASMPRQQPVESHMALDEMAFARKRSAGPGAALGGMLDAAADGIASLAESGTKGFKAQAPSGIEPADAWLDFDSLRLGDSNDHTERGRLIRVRRLELIAEMREEIRIVDVTGARLRDPLSTRGEFDHRYEAEGAAEVPSNGRAHRVSLMRERLAAKARFVTVPRKVADVFREVELVNPLDAPLLLGPIDVMLDGALLTTTQLEEPVDRGGAFAVGLGVEERVRVARNARVRESTVGMLSSSSAIDHQVTIDLVSGLGHPITIEVLERIPITEDKTVKIELIESTPAAETYDQKERGRPIDGGLKWKVGLDAGGKRTLSFTYRIELPAKSELQGGNRRE